MADNIIVGSGPGMESQVKVFSSTLPTRVGQGARGVLDLHALPRVAVRGARWRPAWSTRARAGRASSPRRVPARRRWSRRSAGTCTRRPRARRPTARRPQQRRASRRDPTMTSEFLAYDEGYTGGVALSTGWVAGAEGGAKSIVTEPTGRRRHGCGCGRADRCWTVSRRCTWRARTTTRPNVEVRPDRVVRAVPRCHGGVTVATTSTTMGADLLVAAAPGWPRCASTPWPRPGPMRRRWCRSRSQRCRRAGGVERRPRRSAGDSSGQVPEHPGDEVEDDHPEHVQPDDECRCPASSFALLDASGGGRSQRFSSGLT